MADGRLIRVLTPPILLIVWPKDATNAKNTNVGPLKERIPLTKKKAPCLDSPDFAYCLAEKRKKCKKY